MGNNVGKEVADWSVERRPWLQPTIQHAVGLFRIKFPFDLVQLAKFWPRRQSYGAYIRKGSQSVLRVRKWWQLPTALYVSGLISYRKFPVDRILAPLESYGRWHSWRGYPLERGQDRNQHLCTYLIRFYMLKVTFPFDLLVTRVRTYGVVWDRDREPLNSENEGGRTRNQHLYVLCLIFYGHNFLFDVVQLTESWTRR